MADEANPSGQQPPEGKPDAFVNFWLEQLDAAKQEFKDWETRCKKIKRRYRDERSETQDGTATPGFRFNALWSNIQTLMPAVYINPPKPVAERRFLDKDTLARYASMTLERSLSVQIEVGYLHASMQKAVLDWLLYGRGVVWERYEPKYGEPMDLGETEDAEKPADPGAKGETEEAVRPVTYEKVCTDYVAYDKFRHSPAAIWDDVWWVAKEEMLTRRQLRERFKGKYNGKPIADLIPLQSADKDKQKDDGKGKKLPRACIWEIWDKSRRQVIFIAPDWPNAVVEKADDPLNLETFWPCPEPLYATLTNDTLVPVPDFVEYQDQADELDNLTARIKALTDAVRVNGVYDSSVPELKRILQEGADNRMIGVKNWSELTSKGGLAKSMDFVPFKEVVEALLGLYEARDRVKADMAEITGLSDIIRGQAQGQAKTATEQRIKGQFASLRLEDRKKAVARFCRDAIRIAAEIISEQFEPKLLAEMTGMVPFITTELEDDMQGAAITQQQPGMGHNGGPPMQSPPLAPAGVSPPQAVGAPGGSGLPPAAGMQPPQPPDVNALAEQKFLEACELLKSDKMRTFRIDIETDSTVEVDKQDAKDSVVELFTALGGMLEKAIPAGQALPELVPALGQSLLFAFRRFGAGRDVEGAWENAVDQMIRKAKNPPPPQPSPEQIKAEAEKQKLEMESQQMQQQAGLDQQKAQMDMQVAQAKAQLDIQKQQMQLQIDQQKLQLEREKMEMERQKMAMSLQVEQQKAVIQAESAERDAAFDDRQAERDEARAMREDELADKAMEREQQAGEEKFKLDQKVMQAKAKHAAKPKEREKA